MDLLMGTVTALGAGQTVVVRMDGATDGVTTTIRRAKAYTPVVGDRVLILRGGGGLVALMAL